MHVFLSTGGWPPNFSFQADNYTAACTTGAVDNFEASRHSIEVSKQKAHPRIPFVTLHQLGRVVLVLRERCILIFTAQGDPERFARKDLRLNK
jgi:hypothetical protein